MGAENGQGGDRRRAGGANGNGYAREVELSEEEPGWKREIPCGGPGSPLFLDLALSLVGCTVQGSACADPQIDVLRARILDPYDYSLHVCVPVGAVAAAVAADSAAAFAWNTSRLRLGLPLCREHCRMRNVARLVGRTRVPETPSSP